VHTSPTPAEDKRRHAGVPCRATNALRFYRRHIGSRAGAAFGSCCPPCPSSIRRPTRAQRDGRRRELFAHTVGGA
jgi:hypothetical protein